MQVKKKYGSHHRNMKNKKKYMIFYKMSTKRQNENVNQKRLSSVPASEGIGWAILTFDINIRDTSWKADDKIRLIVKVMETSIYNFCVF